MPELRPFFPTTDARNKILEAALKIFSADGFHGATTRAIAHAARVSQPLLSHHFGGKEELWRLVGERITADFMDYMTNAVDPMLPPGEGVRAMLRGYMGYWKSRPMAFRFNLWRLLNGPREERTLRAEHITRHGVAFMQRAQEAGFVRKDMPAGLALIVGGGLIQFWLHSQLEIQGALAATGDQVGDEAFLDHVLSIVQGVVAATNEKP